MLFSIMFRSAATAALVTLGLWLFLTFIWPVLAGAVAQIVVPPDPRYMALGLQTPGRAAGADSGAAVAVDFVRRDRGGAARSDDPLARADLSRASCRAPCLASPLPLGESVMIAWPQIVGMIADGIMLFVIGYVVVPAPGSARLKQ